MYISSTVKIRLSLVNTNSYLVAHPLQYISCKAQRKGKGEHKMTNEKNVNWNEVKQIYRDAVEVLTLKQYSKLIALNNGDLAYLTSANNLKKVSSNKEVLVAANRIIYLITGDGSAILDLPKPKKALGG